MVGALLGAQALPAVYLRSTGRAWSGDDEVGLGGVTRHNAAACERRPAEAEGTSPPQGSASIGDNLINLDFPCWRLIGRP